MPEPEYMKADPSTVAWSAYNLLAVAGAMPFSPLLDGLRKRWDEDLTEAALSEALLGLIERGRLVLDEASGIFDLKDHRRMILVSRPRDDADPWSGWLVAARPQQVTFPIETILKGK